MVKKIELFMNRSMHLYNIERREREKKVQNINKRTPKTFLYFNKKNLFR